MVWKLIVKFWHFFVIIGVPVFSRTVVVHFSNTAVVGANIAVGVEGISWKFSVPDNSALRKWKLCTIGGHIRLVQRNFSNEYQAWFPRPLSAKYALSIYHGT